MSTTNEDYDSDEYDYDGVVGETGGSSSSTGNQEGELAMPEHNFEERLKEEEAYAGEHLMCVFDVDGSKVSYEFQAGHTVAQLKTKLAKELDIEYGSQQLFLNGDQMMIDPLSLADFNLESGNEVQITVKLV